ncbi:Nif3-like dinuclear metal center hexameric protein [Campylobacter sp.]|uniref:Nif3-like dinuclear metal center hexameric protein n=1 Tax=Campylobacter sp. TaxID=205 RepID=UPI0026DB4E98|nr:Nif3-like dinuclear metal center hexameric protein [Campylobacter sp.]MDO4673826.1 Nif3-like dinuclear metal center hexameric protein [Campylobacter sp.]
MKLSEIYHFLNTLSPFERQESWDNSGILLGDLEGEISTLYLSLDVDEALVKGAEENSLIITHHPLIFKGLKHFCGGSYPRAFLRELIRKNVALIALHTNYDLSHLNAYFVREILGFDVFSQEGFLIYVDVNLSFRALCERVKERLHLPFLRVSDCGKEHLRRIAVCTGSGGDLIPSLREVDCFLSGDFKYHQALEAVSNELSLIDLGHYESEGCFATSLAQNLQNLPLRIIMCVSKNPFQYF